MVLAFGIRCCDILVCDINIFSPMIPSWSSEKTGREGHLRSSVVRGIREKWGIPQKTSYSELCCHKGEQVSRVTLATLNTASFPSGVAQMPQNCTPQCLREISSSAFEVWCGSSQTCCSSMETHSGLLYSAESSVSLLACDPFPHLSCFKVHAEINLTFHTQSITEAQKQFQEVVVSAFEYTKSSWK